MLLGEIHLHAAKDPAVADEKNFSMQVNVRGGQAVKVFLAAVVGIDYRAGYIAGGAGGVVGGDDSWVMRAGAGLVVLTGQLLRREAAEDVVTGRVKGLHLNGLWPAEQHAIGNNLGVESGGAKLLRDVVNVLAVFRCGSEMRLGGEELQHLAGGLGVRYGKKFCFRFGFGGKISEAENGLLCSGLSCGLHGRIGAGGRKQKGGDQQ
jgi:hypothetical protein